MNSNTLIHINLNEFNYCSPAGWRILFLESCTLPPVESLALTSSTLDEVNARLSSDFARGARGLLHGYSYIFLNVLLIDTKCFIYFVCFVYFD